MTPKPVREPSDLIGWTPIKLVARAQEAAVHWADLGDAGFTEPAFRMTVEERLADPACPVALTGLGALPALAAVAPHLRPSGFLFHMSRAGSTLLTNLLRCLDDTLVIAEPRPVNQLLLSPFRNSDREIWSDWLKGLVAALGQPRRPGQSRYFVKFSSHNVLQLDLIRRVFPEVPWLFVYRDPVEVMVSNLERPPAWVEVHHRPPAGRNFLGIEPARLAAMSREEFFAEVFRSFAQAALGAAGSGAFVNYEQLSPANFAAIAEVFGARSAAEAVAPARLEAVFARDAKAAGGSVFRPDRQAKQARAGAEVLAFCRRRLAAPFRTMEEIRLRT